MNRNVIIAIGGAVLAAALILFLLLWQGWLYSYREANELPDRTLVLRDYRVQLSAPEDWVFFSVPNQYLDYPDAPIQALSDKRDAFCIVVPERIGEGRELTLEQFQNIVIETLLKQPEAKLLLQDPATSEWSERSRLVYTSKLGVQTVQYLVQLDLAPPFAYRTICWSAADKYSGYEADFQALCDSLKPVE